MNSRVPDELSLFLTDALGEGWEAERLTGDASIRAYYRVREADGDHVVAAYYPPVIRPDLKRFLAAYDAISGHTRVPPLIQRGEFAVIQKDVGDDSLGELLRTDRNRALPFYREAVDLLVPLRGAGPEAGIVNPPFDRTKFLQELEMAREYYIGHLMDAATPEGDRRVREIFETLIANLLDHPYILCHRDYHGHNLHVFDGDVYVIDYQDLRMGPDTYDLASLLRDRGVADILGRETELELLHRYVAAAGGGPSMEKRYYESLLQRSIKILGTFARQALESGRRHYLAYIPPTLESIRLCVGELGRYEDVLEIFPMDFQISAERHALP
ncbi:MAG: phosphotransferase [Thermoanaerobaculia bacterium]